MKRRLFTLAAAGLLSLSMVGTVSAAPPGVEFRPAPNADSNANCVGVASASAIHNGQASTLGRNAAHGARGDEIKGIQEACPR
jgi:hypothetical protein